ncbi:MAG TPA: GNAT family N-acetyltransferase [Solirubrobacteraceae bacterium]|nr:GNAT family N-acetyltransferase [Solirubrobacteraceae bacterium]
MSPAGEIRWSTGPEDIAGAIALREQVFCLEQGVPVEEELDGRDEEALHLVALDVDGQRVIGTLRLLFDGDVVKVGRVAVERVSRGQGIAARMLDLALQEARARGARRAKLASQVDVVALYEGAGFDIESDVFEEAGIPHVWMGRQLDPSAT